MQLSQARSIRPTCVQRQRAVRVRALFGWGSKQEDTKEAEFRAQQELLQKRRTGEFLKDANERRSKVKETMEARKAERQRERDLLAEGIMPDTLANWKPYQKQEDINANSGIVVPLLPFGIRKYDEGERFDLRSPYADDGWVDPEETDMFAGFKNFGKKFLNFSGKEPETEQGKPIIWASQYEKYKKQQKQQPQQQQQQGGAQLE